MSPCFRQWQLDKLECVVVAHLPSAPVPAGNESCPQPQTSEHLAAIEIMKLKHILILQNKIDLVKESQAKEQYEQILAFVQGESCRQRSLTRLCGSELRFFSAWSRSEPLTLLRVVILLQAPLPKVLRSFPSQRSSSTTSRWFVSTS